MIASGAQAEVGDGMIDAPLPFTQPGTKQENRAPLEAAISRRSWRRLEPTERGMLVGGASDRRTANVTP